MRKSLVLAIAMALGISVPAFATNPFTDVPAGHWAYASVAKLVATGVIDGYQDGTFKGEKLMTRYEMAQIIAKAYAKGEISADDKLIAEFADELDNLGVRVAKLEKKVDNVMFSGEARLGYKDGKSNDEGNDKDKKWYEAELRTRLYLNGVINDNWSYGAMLENSQELNTNKEDYETKFRRAFIRGNIGGVTVTAGRQAFTIGEGYVADLAGDAIKIDFGNALKTTLFAGRFDSVAYGNYSNGAWYDAPTNGYSDKATLYGAVLNYAFNERLYTELGFYALEKSPLTYLYGGWTVPNMYTEQKIYTVGLGYKFDKNTSIYAEYQRADKDINTVIWDTGSVFNFDKDGWAATIRYKGANPIDTGSWGSYVTYYDQSGAVLLDSVSEIEDYLIFPDEGMKGYEIGIDYTLAKNVVASISYYDMDNKNLTEYDDGAKLLWSRLTFNF